MKRFLKWLYKKYEPIFADIIVEEFFRDVPEDIAEPSIDFLLNQKTTLERFFGIQAYKLTRKSLDNKNTEYYTGALMIIKTIVLSLNKVRPIRKEPIEEKKENPLDGVMDFFKKIAERE